MDKADIAAVLALGAALFIAIGDVMHQRSAPRSPTNRSATPIVPPVAAGPRWRLGSGVAAIGFSLQAAALGLGSVLLVQALLVTSLLFALPYQCVSAAPAADPLGMDLGGPAGGVRSA